MASSEVECVPSVTLWKCKCGIEFKVVTETDETTQSHKCTCGLEVEFHGTITEIFIATGAQSLDDRWQRIPTEKFFTAR